MKTYDVQEVEAWIADDPDEHTAKELRQLLELAEDGDTGAAAELSDRFSGELEFGTAGLRGHLGGGPNRMNRAVVLRAAAGLMDFLRARLPGGYKVVIGYDARHGSRQFALDTAAVAEANGGHALIFDQPLPTPLTAFAIRALGADAAVMVTASHNPPEDNGYKVYLGGRVVEGAGQGAQIVPPYDAEIFEAIQAVPSVESIRRADSGWEWLGRSLVDHYLARVSDLISAGPRDLKIVVTSMHGVGGEVMLEALENVGFLDVTAVPEQHEPDPNFPTVAFPNPEEPGALDLAMGLAEDVGAELILANDPDADRSSAAVPAPDLPGGWRQLSGNEVGGLLGEQTAKELEGVPGAVLANSLVSSRLLEKIAKKYRLGHKRTLTGFKWIARVPGLVYGFEEAIGYCCDPEYVRDKDGISASTRLASLAAELKASGSSLQEMLDEQAIEYGLHATAPLTIRVDDLSLIAKGMANLRAAGPTVIAGSPVVDSIDLSAGSDELPPTDGLLYLTEAGDQVVVRPSGTEPKLKCYIEAIIPVTNRDVEAARREGAERLEDIKADMVVAIGI